MKLRVLVGCECSGRVRDAFAALGHDAWSCDLLPCESGGQHLQCDVMEVLSQHWDIGIFFPTCTYLTCSAEWAYKDPDFERYPGVGYHQRVKPETLTGAARRAARQQAIAFAVALHDCHIPLVGIENPVGVLSSQWKEPSQTIQPYQFGDDASKRTCLWLKGLPLLQHTTRCPGRMVNWGGRTVDRWSNQTDSGQNRLPPSDDRSQIRAITYPGIADQMAQQWGTLG